MLLFELGIFPLERLELRNLSRRTRRWCVGRPTAEPTILHVLPPLGQHEGMDLERGGDGLDLHPGC
jgi:hypothetical protein